MKCYVVFSVLLVIFSDIQAQYDEPCQYPNGERGTCKRIEDCASAIQQVKILRRHDKRRCGFHKNEEIVCCNDIAPLIGARGSDEEPIWGDNDDNGTTKTAAKNSISLKSLRKSELVCEEYSNEVDIKVDLHILGGEDAKPGEFPHMSLLGYVTAEGTKWQCGGSLISNRYVLTAAHCIVNPDSLRPSKVRMGMISLEGGKANDAKNPPAVEFGVDNITVHPGYIRRTSANDIALIRLNKDVTFNSYIHPACLYNKMDDPLGLIVSGWGYIDRDYSERKDILQKAPVQPIDMDRCNATYATRRRPLSNKQICAGSSSGEQDSCQGDSGGPLQKYTNENVFVVVGIISFGMGCGGLVPAVYTRVAQYLDWIEPIVWPV